MKWIARIVGGILGAIGVVLGLTRIFGDVSLPACDASEPFDSVRQLAVQLTSKLVTGSMDAEAVKAAVEIADAAEVSFDKDKQIRECTATISLRINNTTAFDKQKVSYTLSWIDRDKGTFNTQLKLN